MVALGPRDDAEVAVLGGGWGVVWGVPADPLGLAELGPGRDAAGAAPDDPDEVAVCLDDLVERGLVSWMIEEDEL